MPHTLKDLTFFSVQVVLGYVPDLCVWSMLLSLTCLMHTEGMSFTAPYCEE